jgi:uncharacterized membrane protein YjjB (DUF3815 family)
MSVLLGALAAGVGTMAFSLLYGVPNKFYPYCGLIGGTGWLVYSWCREGLQISIATFVATIVVILLSRYFAVRKRCPVTIFLISGIFPLVPGAGIYWSAYYIVTNQLLKAAQTGFIAFKAAVAIVLGIAFVFELPSRVFRFGKKKQERNIKK